MKFADRVKKMVDEAPVVTGRGPNVNFGPCVFTPIVLKWQGRGAGSRPDKTPLDEYMKQNNLTEDDGLELAEGESLYLQVDIDITELNPSLGFHYERDIALLVSNKTSKDPAKHILTDWSEIVQPSLEKVFGKDWEQKVLANGKKAAPVVYLAAENADNVNPPKEGKRSYGVPKFLAVYADLDECREARDKRYPPRDEEAEMAFPPDGEVGDDEDEDGFPIEVIDQVKSLYQSTRKNAKQTHKMLVASGEYEEYDMKDLMEAAGIDVSGIKFA